MHRHHVQQVCPFFATKFSLHERSRDSPFNTYRQLLLRVSALWRRKLSVSIFTSSPLHSYTVGGRVAQFLFVVELLMHVAFFLRKDSLKH